MKMLQSQLELSEVVVEQWKEKEILNIKKTLGHILTNNHESFS